MPSTVDVVVHGEVDGYTSAFAAAMISDESQELLRLPALDATVGSLRESTEGAADASLSLDAGDMLAVLEDVVIASVVGSVDDTAEACTAEEATVAAAAAVDAQGRGVGAEGEDGGENGGDELHFGVG